MYYSKELTENMKDQTFSCIRVTQEEQVLYLTLNRPAKKNALNPVMVNELAYAMSYAHHHASVWAVVLRAEGDVFCAGADLKSFTAGSTETDSTIPPPPGEVMISELFHKLYKPCIAQVEGQVYAGGFLLIAGCTHVVAGYGLTFGLPEVKRGLFPFQVMASLLEVLPSRIVLDWCIRGRNLSAEEAFRWGLVTHLAETEQVEQQVQELLEDILTNSPTAIRKGLEAYDHIRRRLTAEEHRYLRDMLLQTLQTRDAVEGIAAFREKRMPVWTNG